MLLWFVSSPAKFALGHDDAEDLTCDVPLAAADDLLIGPGRRGPGRSTRAGGRLPVSEGCASVQPMASAHSVSK